MIRAQRTHAPPQTVAAHVECAPPPAPRRRYRPHRRARAERRARRRSRCSPSRCRDPGCGARAPDRSRARSAARSARRSASAESARADRHTSADPRTSSAASDTPPGCARGCAAAAAPRCAQRCAAASTRRRSCRGARLRRQLAAHASSSAAASSRALSVPWPKCSSRAREPPRAARASNAATVSRSGLACRRRRVCDNCRMNRRTLSCCSPCSARLALAAGALLARLLGSTQRDAAERHLAAARAPLASFTCSDLVRPATSASSSLRGHPTLLFFGFTNCPDVCPTTLAHAGAAAARRAAARGAGGVRDHRSASATARRSCESTSAPSARTFIGARGDTPALAPLLQSLSAHRGAREPARRQLHDGSFGDAVPARYPRSAGWRCSPRRSRHAALTADLQRIGAAHAL